ncbi:MAG: Hypoxanthine-guanine phosphoribosyltransferase [Pseudomonadota bacterium]|jgi:hypoxanthine phosphoribosyltransferase
MQFKPLFDEATLARRVAELGKEISAAIPATDTEPLVVICILKGAFMFAADLVRHIKIPLEIDFMGLASYEGTKSSGEIKVTREIAARIEGRHVLVVEDIVDTGTTLDFLREQLTRKKPKSLRFCTLLSKPEAHQTKTAIEFVGFEISREFVIGYGLDLDQRYRELPYIAQVVT